MSMTTIEDLHDQLQQKENELDDAQTRIGQLEEDLRAANLIIEARTTQLALATDDRDTFKELYEAYRASNSLLEGKLRTCEQAQEPSPWTIR